MAKTRPDQNRHKTCPCCGANFLFHPERHCWSPPPVMCPACPGEMPSPACADCTDFLSSGLSPMLASHSDIPDDQQDWLFEYKWDGVRAFACLTPQSTRLWSRNSNEITSHYPELADLGPQLARHTAIIDGEIITLDQHGQPSFHILQRRMHADPTTAATLAARMPVWFFAFDLLMIDSRPLFNEPLTLRRGLLESLGISHPQYCISPAYPGNGSEMLAAARENHLEGIMAKRPESLYTPGRRSSQWLKIKIVHSQEFVIGGWMPEKSSASRIGSLLIGYYDTRGYLLYAGSIGSGFSGDDHKLVFEKLRRLQTDKNPFVAGIPRPGCYYVRPELVVQVEFRRWPEDGLVQHGAYKGLRTDKPPADIRKEPMYA